jgi:hypothetical protein
MGIEKGESIFAVQNHLVDIPLFGCIMHFKCM